MAMKFPGMLARKPLRAGIDSASGATLLCVGVALAVAAGVGAWVFRRFGPSTYLRFPSKFGTARIYQVDDGQGAAVRLLEVGGIVQSGTYVDDDRCYDLVFEYLKKYDTMFERGVPIERVCVLGCGGYDYPEHLLAHHPGVVIDAVEIDPVITALARRYFFLDRALEEFDVEASGRLNLIEADGREFLEQQGPMYDAIVNDTFDAGEPAAGLVGIDAARAIHARLNPGGLYLVNVVSALEGPRSAFLRQQMSDLEQVFSQVEVLPCATDCFAEDDNVIVVAQR